MAVGSWKLLYNFASSRKVNRYSWKMLLRLREILWTVCELHNILRFICLCILYYVQYMYMHIHAYIFLDACYTPYLHRNKHFIWIQFKISCSKQDTSNLKSILSGREALWWEMLTYDHKGVLMICECKRCNYKLKSFAISKFFFS